MKNLLVALSIMFTVNIAWGSEMPDHSIWERLLQRNVSGSSGTVNYKGFLTKQDTLDSYLKELKLHGPQADWSKNDKKAYYMNAYNAYTVKFILRRYPVASVKDVKFSGKDIWNTKLVSLGGKTYTLSYIENEILRRTGDPRIHFGINCASYSCPKLYNHAFTGKNVNSALTKLTKSYVNNEKHNIISDKKIKLAKIFDWYAVDFKKNQTLIEWLNKYSNVTINGDAKIEFLDYNWSLNDK